MFVRLFTIVSKISLVSHSTNQMLVGKLNEFIENSSILKDK